MSYTPPASNAVDFSWQGEAAYTPPAATAVDFDFSAGLAVAGYVAAPSPLGAATLTAEVVAQGLAAAPGPLGAPAVLGWQPVHGYAEVPGPLGAPWVFGTAGFIGLAWAAAPSPLGVPTVVAGFVPQGLAAAPGPLGAPAVLAQGVAQARALVAGPLGDARVLAGQPLLAFAAAPSPLGALAPAVLAFHDFTQAGEVLAGVNYYALDLVQGGAVVARLPMSSWQATLQTGRSNYLQAVVPAAAPWVAALTAASGTGEFVVQRGVRLADGAAIEQEMARAPLQTLRFDQGPGRLTGTLSGYTPAFAGGDATVRELAQVRSQSFGAGGRRVRCGIDWFLRPGMQAELGAEAFEVAYINYYVSMSAGNGDAYMDVGERAVA